MVVVKILRGVLIFLLSFLFVSLLFATSSTFIFSEVTEESVVKPLIISAFSNLGGLNEQELTETQKNLLLMCEGKDEVDLPLGEEGKEPEDIMNINCEDIKQGKSLKDILIDYSFKKIYYPELSCDFLACLKEESEFPPILTKKANDFFKAIKYKLLIAAIIVGIILFLIGGLSRAARNLIIAGIPAIPLVLGRNALLQNFSGGKMQMFIPIINAVLPLSIQIFSTYLISGVILFVISFILKRKKKAEEKPVKRTKRARKAKKKELKRALIPIKAISKKRAKQRKAAVKKAEIKKIEKTGVKVIKTKRKK